MLDGSRTSTAVRRNGRHDTHAQSRARHDRTDYTFVVGMHNIVPAGVDDNYANHHNR